jgi:aminodeoxyfutalosine deaminase
LKNWIKYKAAQIFDGYKFLPPNSVLITTNEGVIESIVTEDEAGREGIVELSGILTPGFINAHCHTELSYLKNKIPQHSGLVNFLIEVTKQRNSFTQQEIEESICNAIKEMQANGIVAVGDICNTANSIAAKRNNNIQFHNFIETIGFDPSTAEEKISQSLVLKQQFVNELPFRNSSICPHAPYSVSNELLTLINADISNQISSIHSQETACEEEWFLHQTGKFKKLFDFFGFDTSFFKGNQKGSLANTINYLFSAKKLLLVHNTFTNKESIALLKNKINANEIGNIYWCLCPNANLYIENALPNVPLLINSAMPLIIGTDSLASNSELNILAEINTLQKHYPQINIETILQAATINGATALNMQDTLGSFAKGKKPGVLLLGINKNGSFNNYLKVIK